MKLENLLPLLDDMPAFRGLLESLRKSDRAVRASVLHAARPYFLAALQQRLGAPVILITARPEDARHLQEQLQVWHSRVRLLPEPDALPYQRVDQDTTTRLERLQVLSALAGDPSETIFVISAPALIQKTAPHAAFAAAAHGIKTGTKLEPLRLLEKWQGMGYRRENMVEVPGAMSQRGGILDIYPPDYDFPARIEFFGNTIDSIRLFEPATQKSRERVESVNIIPATEMFDTSEPFRLDISRCVPDVRERYERELGMLAERHDFAGREFYAPLFANGSLLDYFPAGAYLVLDRPREVNLAITDFDTRAEELRQGQVERGELPPDFPRPYLTLEDVAAGMFVRRLELAGFDSRDGVEHELDFAPAPAYAGQLKVFLKKAKQLLTERKRTFVASYQAGRLTELLDEENIISLHLAEVKDVPAPGSLVLGPGSPAGGWVMGGETYFFTDTEIFGFTKERRPVKKRPVARRKLLGTLIPGTYVVHVEHGIGKFSGVVVNRTAGTEKEYIVLKYASGDKLLVPIEQIDRLDRYVGAGERPPALSRLGTQEWVRTKARVKESVREVARELLALYAERQVSPGFAFSPDTVWQQELEASFPYVETPDQVEVVEQVKADMELPRPMDRLVCGDVGYGKTEVALRAAFKAVMDSRQVALLVPTTILAEQHYKTFSERLAAYPVRVEVLSRFRRPAEQKEVVAGLAGGKVDIVIGTHRLLQKDVRFANIGLLIIDEEQRFGVAHKEYLKKMRKEVDVLTLSATPIPRTLSMALAGVRDMSVIETPPEDRLPIKTHVAEFDDRLVREAVLRELERNGQVFLVHNRVQGIYMIAEKMRRLIPEARIAIAHGQMPEADLAQVMSDFTREKYDVLVCTTIIESGLDMPRVNTLIVNRADKFGLTQLYQLRGRVGRGANLAYAYFLYDHQKRLSPTAEKRLQTIYEATELGAGFAIAMKDLEIRGAGTLLGVKQSGFISAVGFSLYNRLLAEAVAELKAQRCGAEKTVKSPLPAPSVDLRLPAYIPAGYVPELSSRLELYQGLSRVTKARDAEELGKEIRDRFGPLPIEVENLLFVVKVKALGAGAGIESITTEDSQVVLRRFQGLSFDRPTLEPIFREGVRVSPAQLRVSLRHRGWRDTLEKVLSKVG